LGSAWSLMPPCKNLQLFSCRKRKYLHVFAALSRFFFICWRTYLINAWVDWWKNILNYGCVFSQFVILKIFIFLTRKFFSFFGLKKQSTICKNQVLSYFNSLCHGPQNEKDFYLSAIGDFFYLSWSVVHNFKQSFLTRSFFTRVFIHLVSNNNTLDIQRLDQNAYPLKFWYKKGQSPCIFS